MSSTSSEQIKLETACKNDQILKSTKLPFTDNALKVLEKRYLVHSHEGELLENAEQMFMRVARTIAQVEERYGCTREQIDIFAREFYSIMSGFEFTPAGRTLANAGGPTKLVSNCVVLHIKDSMEDIFQTLKDAALGQKAGCGLGFPLHLMRPAGSMTKSSFGISSGPVSFLHVYNTAFGVIKQQNRHGANMAVMKVDHPDILEFIHCKDREGDLRNFNVSVGITNEFMKQVKNNSTKPWLCKFEEERYKPRIITRDENWSILSVKDQTLTARQLFQEMINSSWKTGEPGVVFLDTVNETNPLPGIGPIEASNPCFHPDTLIETEHGPKKISDIKEPIKVYSMDRKRQPCLRQASTAFKTRTGAEIIKITVSNGSSLVITPDHKVFSSYYSKELNCIKSEWIEAKNLKIGYTLIELKKRDNSSKKNPTVISIEKLQETVDVWDIQVEETHCLFANGILAHNCGEQFLHDGDVCNLGSINLEKFVTTDRRIDFDRLRQVTRLAVRMLDNVIDISDFPVEKMNSVFRANRRVGLGIMGFADMLYLLEIGYNTEEGRSIAGKVMQCINDTAHEMSRQLAKEKGCFPNWDKSIYGQRGIPYRNAALTNVPPTGTISMLFDCSGGVEPYFALAYYYKNILGGSVQLSYVNKHLQSALERVDLYTPEIMERIIHEGSVARVTELPPSIRRTFVTSMDISAEDHIAMQATFQRHCDNAISKTINFPNSATKEDILEGYIKAWESGCKGCTVYRDGSRFEQVLNLNKDKKSDSTTNLNALDSTYEYEQLTREIKDSSPLQQNNTEICPDCNSDIRKSSEKCQTCDNCGYSKCIM